MARCTGRDTLADAALPLGCGGCTAAAAVCGAIWAVLIFNCNAAAQAELLQREVQHEEHVRSGPSWETAGHALVQLTSQLLDLLQQARPGQHAGGPAPAAGTPSLLLLTSLTLRAQPCEVACHKDEAPLSAMRACWACTCHSLTLP